MSAPRTVELAFSRVGAVPLAIEAAAALRFGESAPGQLGESTRWLDAAALLGGEVDPDRPRRYALLRLAEGAPLLLLLGRSLEIRPVELAALHGVPALLAPAAERLGCRGLVRESERFSFLLDASSLASLSQRARPPRE